MKNNLTEYNTDEENDEGGAMRSRIGNTLLLPRDETVYL
jgi:hypothetical protein